MISKHVKFLPILIIAALTFSQQTGASNFSYDYVEAARIKSETDVSGIELDGEGNGILISHSIASNLAVSLIYQEEEFDFDFEGEALTIGFDFHASISEWSDIVLSIAAIEVEISQPLLGSEDDTGNIVQLGLKNKVNESVEIDVFVSRTDTFDETVTSYGLGLNLGSSEGIQLILGYGTSDDTDVVAASVRFNY